MMNLRDFFKSVSPLEMFLLIVFVFYLIFPVSTPNELAPYIDSSLGMAVVFIVTIYLFLYTTPILGILSIFVAYELLRRSSAVLFGKVVGRSDTTWISGNTPAVEHAPTQQKKDVQMAKMNPPAVTTLEEQVVSQMAPIGKSDPMTFIDTSYKPVQDKIVGGTLL